MLPRIPKADSRADFDMFAESGRRLTELHLNYETVKPYPLAEVVTGTLSGDDRELWRARKMKWRSKGDRSTLIYNSHLTLAGIPDEAHR